MLIAIAPSTENSLLAASQMTLLGFAAIGIPRRMLFDGFYWGLGRRGVAGLKDSRISYLRELARRAEEGKPERSRMRFEPKWVYRLDNWVRAYFRRHQDTEWVVLLYHALNPDGWSSYLLGKMRVPVWKIIPCNIFGSILHVALFYVAGSWLEGFFFWLRIISFTVTIAILVGAALWIGRETSRYLHKRRLKNRSATIEDDAKKTA